MKTVAVIEGFSGGPMKTREFRKELSDSGFRVIKDRRRADIIVAHSAGIYAVPLDANAGLVMLIGPTYWPNRPLLKRLLSHIRATKRYHIAKFGALLHVEEGFGSLLFLHASQVFMAGDHP